MGYRRQAGGGISDPQHCGTAFRVAGRGGLLVGVVSFAMVSRKIPGTLVGFDEVVRPVETSSRMQGSPCYLSGLMRAKNPSMSPLPYLHASGVDLKKCRLIAKPRRQSWNFTLSRVQTFSVASVPNMASAARLRFTFQIFAKEPVLFGLGSERIPSRLGHTSSPRNQLVCYFSIAALYGPVGIIQIRKTLPNHSGHEGASMPRISF